MLYHMFYTLNSIENLEQQVKDLISEKDILIIIDSYYQTNTLHIMTVGKITKEYQTKLIKIEKNIWKIHDHELSVIIEIHNKLLCNFFDDESYDKELLLLVSENKNLIIELKMKL